MKHLKLRKIKIAKINNPSTILGGNDRQTIILGCMPDTHTCPTEKTQDPNDSGCEGTNEGTKTLGGFAETSECDATGIVCP